MTMAAGGLIQPITDDDRRMFMDLAPGIISKSLPSGMKVTADDLNFEEVDQHWQVSYATTDIGSAGAAFKKVVTVDLSANKVETVQTQDPILNGSANNAGDQLIALFGLSARLYRGAITLANLRLILLDLEPTIAFMQNATMRKVEIFGDTFIHAGADYLVDGIAVPVSQVVLGDKRMRKFGLPFTIGKEQKFTFQHWIGKTTAWSSAFVLDFYAPSIVARRK